MLVAAAMSAGVALALALAAVVAWLRRRVALPADAGDLEAAIDRTAGAGLGPTPRSGLVVGVCKGGRLALRGHGVLDASAPTPPDGRTVFPIASVSKLFTAHLLQVLCEQGVARLDADLDELLGARWALSPSVRKVTLRQLATHTAGFPSVPASLQALARERGGARAWQADPYAHLQREDILRHLARAPGHRRPGRFRYSNFGMGLLGHVLEDVTGDDYESLVVRHVLAPLGMADTRITLTPDLQARLAPGHDAREAPAAHWHFASLAGAGGFVSTAQDLLRYLQACLAAGTPAAHSFEAMRAAQGRGVTGLGWMQAGRVERLLGLHGLVWHNGRVAGAAAFVSVDPVSRSGVVVLANRSVDVTLLGLRLARRARSQSWSAPA